MTSLPVSSSQTQSAPATSQTTAIAACQPPTVEAPTTIINESANIPQPDASPIPATVQPPPFPAPQRIECGAERREGSASTPSSPNLSSTTPTGLSQPPTVEAAARMTDQAVNIPPPDATPTLNTEQPPTNPIPQTNECATERAEGTGSISTNVVINPAHDITEITLDANCPPPAPYNEAAVGNNPDAEAPPPPPSETGGFMSELEGSVVSKTRFLLNSRRQRARFDATVNDRTLPKSVRDAAALTVAAIDKAMTLIQSGETLPEEEEVRIGSGALLKKRKKPPSSRKTKRKRRRFCRGDADADVLSVSSNTTEEEEDEGIPVDQLAPAKDQAITTAEVESTALTTVPAPTDTQPQGIDPVPSAMDPLTPAMHSVPTPMDAEPQAPTPTGTQDQNANSSGPAPSPQGIILKFHHELQPILNLYELPLARPGYEMAVKASLHLFKVRSTNITHHGDYPQSLSQLI